MRSACGRTPRCASRDHPDERPPRRRLPALTSVDRGVETSSRSLSPRGEPPEGGHHGLLTGHLLGAAFTVEDAQARIGGVLDAAAAVLEELARELHVAGGDL